MDSERYKKIKQIFQTACELDLAEREKFLRNYDASDTLKREVEKMLAFADDETDGDKFEKNAFETLKFTSDTKIPKQIGNYKILREIGRGGMGVVYEAVRESANFKQKAALKVIKRGMDTDAILSRFRTEQKILASLEHPCVARFLDGGMTDDGLAFYAMEFVEGTEIDQYFRENSLPIADEIKIFREVCSAVQYAHQNLVVHRDLKPSNILVTRDRTPKLLDFGIGKILTEDAEIGTATQYGMLTPQYASPEQLRGERIGTTSDIYSLGVILYELLTGEKPYKFNPLNRLEIEKAILEIEPTKPSAVKSPKSKVQSSESKDEDKNPKSKIQNPKSLKGDLDNIVLKCLQKEPSRRYASVGQFSEDLRRYLEGLPVLARPQNFSYRAAKFIKRNRVPVIAAVLIFAGLFAGITIAIWQAHKAQIEKQRAEKRFDEVRRLAGKVVFKYHDAIAELPGATATREMLVKDALEYLDNLAAESTDKPELRRELAAAYLKLGDVQGKQYGANLGDSAGATESYRKAVNLLENLSGGQKFSPEIAFESVTAYESLFTISMRTANKEERNLTLEKAMNLSEKLIAAEPQNAKYKLQNVRLLVQAGDNENIYEKLPFYKKAFPMIEEMHNVNSSDKEFKRIFLRVNQRLGTTHIWIGDKDLKNGRTDAAKENYALALPFQQKTAELTEQLYNLEPQNYVFKRNYAISLNNLALAFAKNGKRAESLAIIDKGIAILKQIENDDTRNSETKSDIAFAHENKAEIFEVLEEKKLAVFELEIAVGLHQKVWLKDEKNVEAIVAIKDNYQKTSALYRQIGNQSKADSYEQKYNEFIEIEAAAKQKKS